MALAYYYEDAIRNSKNEIDLKKDEFLLAVDSNELAKYYFDTYALPLIEQDAKKEIEYRQEGNTYNGTLIKIFYPIIPKNNLETVIELQAKTRLLSFQLSILGSSLVSSTYVDLSSADSSSNRIKQIIEYMEQTITYKNQSVKEGNERLQNELLTYINDKKSRLQSNSIALESIIKKVPIPLRKKTESLPVISLTVKETIRPVYPTPQVPTEPMLEKEKVTAVVTLIENGGRSFETTPSVYSKLDEEALRDILLSHLNCVFEGNATGETFVKKGKTDIHLKMDKGSILSMECKFWEGEKHYLDTINQLLGYLTWRQDYGVVIIFCKRENFTEIIEKAKQASNSHPSFVKDTLADLSSTHFSTINTIPEDHQKKIVLHHLFFNLFVS
jgi:hypothetical protein